MTTGLIDGIKLRGVQDDGSSQRSSNRIDFSTSLADRQAARPHPFVVWMRDPTGRIGTFPGLDCWFFTFALLDYLIFFYFFFLLFSFTRYHIDRIHDKGGAAGGRICL